MAKTKRTATAAGFCPFPSVVRAQCKKPKRYLTKELFLSYRCDHNYTIKCLNTQEKRTKTAINAIFLHISRHTAQAATPRKTVRVATFYFGVSSVWLASSTLQSGFPSHSAT